MKKIQYIFGLSAALVLASCGNKKTETDVVPAGYQLVDLNPYGFSASILIPDSTKIQSPLEIKQMAGVEIKRGRGFDIVINTGDGEVTDMTFQKSQIEHEDPKKVKRWILDEKNAVIYEQQIMDLKPEVHMYAVVPVGTTNYTISDNHQSEEPYKEENIKMMMEAAKSIQLLNSPATKDAPKP
jgi:hypothetical protein